MAINLDESSWGDEEISALLKTISSDRTTMGTQVKDFENKFANYVGAKYALMVNSGSSANLLASASLQTKFPIRNNRNIVLVPTLSWSTTYFPLLQNGYELRFIDINLHDFNISTVNLEQAVCERTVGICVPHILGAAADLERLMSICEKFDLWLFEDTCESLGNKPFEHEDKLLGAYGDVGTYSFFRSHHISTMEGGMFVTSDEEMFIYASSIRNHGWARDIKPNLYLNNFNNDPWEEKFKFYLPGYNLRPLEISGAIGLVQLNKLDTFIFHRKNNARILQENLDKDKYQIQAQGVEGSWMAFSLLIKNEYIPRSNVLDVLKDHKTETRPIVTGNFLNQPVIEKIRSKVHLFGEYPNATYVDSRGFMFANHGRDMKRELIQISKILNEVS